MALHHGECPANRILSVLSLPRHLEIDTKKYSGGPPAQTSPYSSIGIFLNHFSNKRTILKDLV